MTATGSIVVVCPMCRGTGKANGLLDCHNCNYRTPRQYNRPGPGFVLEGQRLDEFPLGTQVRDIWRGQAFVIEAKKRDHYLVRVVTPGFGFAKPGVLQKDWNNNGQRYVSEERYWEAATWARPDGKSSAPKSVVTGQQVLL